MNEKGRKDRRPKFMMVGRGRNDATTAQFWMNLQTRHDLEKAEDALGEVIAEIPRYRRKSA